jgi:hypothetical protein
MMRRTVLAALCGAALIATPAAVAYAQAPQPTTIDVDKSVCGTVTLTLTGPDDGISGVHGFRWNAVNGSVATDEGARTGTVVVGDADVKTVDIVFAEDEFGGTAAVTVAVFFGPNSFLQTPLDIYPVDTDCADPTTTTPTATPDPTSTVTPTPTSTATTTPEPTLTPGDGDDFDQVGQVPVGGVATGG